MAIAAPKAELVVKLNEIRHTECFPAPQQACGNVAVLLGALSLDIDPMAKYVDDVEGIKFTITF